jgi:hypothetical protein
VTIQEIPTSGSATSMTKRMEYYLSGCDASTRLSWHVAGMGYKKWKVNNGNQWMYIDNIKVQIAK